MDDNIRHTNPKSYLEQDPLSMSEVEIKENNLYSQDSKYSRIDQKYIYEDVKKCSPICQESEEKKNTDCCECPDNIETKSKENVIENLKNRNINFYQQQENLYVSMRQKCQKNKENISSMKMTKYALGFMLFYLAIYFFISLTLLIANLNPQEVIEAKYGLPFHLMDFWCSFVFALVETAVLIAASMLEFGNLRFFIALINIGLTLIAAILFSFNPEFWERSAHWVEYSAQICLTLSDLLFISYQFKNKSTNNILYKYRYYEIAFVVLLFCASILKLLVFGSVVMFGESPEHTAHYFEFVGEMANSLFIFVFTYVLFQDCEENLKKMANYENLDEHAERK